MSDPVAPAATGLSYFDMNAEQRLSAMLELERAKNELGTQLAVAREQRDAAEDRFVKAREENSELEQEMADLRVDLLREKAMNAEANVRPVARRSWLRPWWKRIFG